MRRSLALPAALFSLAAAPLPAQVTVAASVGELNAGESSVLTAAWTGPGAQPAWEWILEPRGAGTLVQDGSARATYTAPGFPVEGEDVRLTAIPSCDRGAARIAMVRILPSAGMKVILDTIVAGYLGGDLFEPGLRLLAGSPRENGDQRSEGLGRGDAARFWGVFGMAFVERHPDPALQGRWLVATHGGLRVLSPEGDLGHWEGCGSCPRRGTWATGRAPARPKARSVAPASPAPTSTRSPSAPGPEDPGRGSSVPPRGGRCTGWMSMAKSRSWPAR